MPDALPLPDVLTEHHDPLERALQVAVPATFPEDETFQDAAQPEAIAKALIRTPIHAALAGAKLAYLFRQQIETKGKIKLGTAAKASGKVRFLTGIDFILEFNWTAYRALTPVQRLALLDHELCHCGRDPETSSFVLVPHDVEEFGAIVRRWGLWKPDLIQFGLDVKAQLELVLAPVGA